MKSLSKNNDNVQFKIINTVNEKLNTGDNVKTEFLSDLKIDIDRNEYLEIKKHLYENNKNNQKQFLKNFLNLREFHLNGIFLGNLIEVIFNINLIKNFGEYELLKKILQTEKYDKAIIFNFNNDFFDLIKSLYTEFNNLEVYQDNTLNIINKRLKWFIYYWLFLIFKNSIKGFIFSKIYRKEKFNVKIKKNIIFFVKLKRSNQYRSLNPVYEDLKKSKELRSIYFFLLKDFIPFNELLRFLFNIKKLWSTNRDKIMNNMKYDLIKFNNIMNDFYKFDLLFTLISGFIDFVHFNEFFQLFPPSLIVISDLWSFSTELLIQICNEQNIPSIYIQHAASANHDEMITKCNVGYITVAGENEKIYFLKRGEEDHKIIVTGRPRYEFFYTGEINEIHEVKDMFNNKVYKLNKSKFTILLTTNHVSDKTNEIILTSVINSLRELNLIDNFIIKLHPKETGNIHKKVLQKFNINTVIVKDYNILELIKSCNLLLSRGSTTVLEAMIVGTPVIVLDFSNIDFIRTGRDLFLEENGLITVINQEELIECLKKLINDSDYYKRYSENLNMISKDYSFFNEKETPTKRISNFIKSLINEDENNY